MCFYSEYLAHEIRNPLSSAIVAHSFARNTLAESCIDADVQSSIEADHKIVDTSLRFIDDFLRSMLLLYRASANKLEVDLSPTNIFTSVLEPVRNILNPRSEDDVKVIVDCPTDLAVMTDALRLKQVLLNLGSSEYRNHVDLDQIIPALFA